MKYRSIQGLRGAAASLVVCLHLATFLAHGGHQLAVAFYGFIANIAAIGVDIFFIVSGVIMAGILKRGSGGPRAASRFFIRRAIRIYPVFWLSLLVITGILVMFGMTWPNTFSPQHYNFGSLFLIHTHEMHPVSWTLVLEIQFYLAAGIALLFGRFAVKVLALFAIAHMVITISASFGYVPRQNFTLPITFEFLLGLMVGFAVPQVRIPAIIFPIAVLAVLALQLYFGFEHLAYTTGWLRLAVNGTSAALIVWSALSWELSGGKTPNLLVVAGDLSYSIYLWHWPVLLLLLATLGSILTRSSGLLLFAGLGIALTALCGYFSFKYLEQPANSLANRLTSRSRGGGSANNALQV